MKIYKRNCVDFNSDNGKAFSSQGKVGILNRPEKSRKMTQTTGKLGEFIQLLF